MASRIQIYQGALRLLGPSQLASLSEDRPEKLRLDEAWGPSVAYLLEQGLWNFALRTIQLSPDDDVEPLFGYDYGFSKPDDWVRTGGLSSTGIFSMDEPFNDFEDQEGYWYASTDPLYVQYVSNGDAYGFNVGAWRQNFAKALEAYLAFECGLPISADRGNRNDLHTLYEKRLARAKNLDAVDERVRRRPQGTLVKTRYAGLRNRMNG